MLLMACTGLAIVGGFTSVQTFASATSTGPHGREVRSAITPMRPPELPAVTSTYVTLNAPVVGIVPSTDGGGYFMVAADEVSLPSVMHASRDRVRPSEAVPVLP